MKEGLCTFSQGFPEGRGEAFEVGPRIGSYKKNRELMIPVRALGKAARLHRCLGETSSVAAHNIACLGALHL